MGEIILKISKKDPTKISAEVEGMRGQGCQSALDAFQQATKLATRKQTIKPEFRDEVKQRIPHRR